MGKVKFGLKNVHIAPIMEDGSYGDIFALKGAVNLSIDAEGESANFAADDDAKYFSQFSNNGYSGSLEVALINEDFLTKILGQTKDANGAIIETTGDKMKEFAMMFEVSTDVENRRTVYYRVSASRPSVEHSTTEDQIEPQTDTINISIGANENGEVKATLPSTSDAYATFFESVYRKSV